MKRATFYLVIVASVGLTCIGSWLGDKAFYSIRSTGWGSVDSLGLLYGTVLAAVVVGIMLHGLPRFLPGASVVEVNEREVRLNYPGGRTDILPWNDRGSRIVLYDFGNYPTMIQQGRAYVVLIPFGRSTLVTKECLEGILEQARKVKVRVRTSRGDASWYGFSPVIFRIRGGVAPTPVA
jgi:hypothetical protein